jgi:peptidase M28-like protein
MEAAMAQDSRAIDRRHFLETGLGVAAGAALAAFPSAASAAAPAAADTAEIFGWIEDLWRFGRDDRYGYRMPGSKSDRQGAQYVFDRFAQFGLKNSRLEAIPAAVALPDRWTLTVRRDGRAEEMPCCFLRYAKFTGAAGVSGPIVYVGHGTEADFARSDVRGKIVLADVVSDGWDRLSPYSFYKYDVHGTLAGDKARENWPPKNFSTYQEAFKRGAVGWVGILDLMAADVNQYLHTYVRYELPALTVSARDASALRGALRGGGSAAATLTLTGFRGQGETYNVYGFVPGRTDDEIIVVKSHHDGWATNDASGTAVVLGLAKYFAQLPPRSLNRTLMFFLKGAHFGRAWPYGTSELEPAEIAELTAAYGLDPGWEQFRSLAADLAPRTVCANNIEMIGRQYKRKGDTFEATGRICPRAWGVTGPAADQANPALLSMVRRAIEQHDLDRSEVWPYFIGDGGYYVDHGIPLVNLISNHPWQFCNRDTPETVMKEALAPTVAAFVDIVRQQDAADVAAINPVHRTRNAIPTR